MLSNAGQANSGVTGRIRSIKGRPSQTGICEFLATEYGLSGARPGKAKLACPFCGHRTFSVKGDDSLGKCFHPSCGKHITPAQTEKQYRTGLFAVHQELFESWHRSLLNSRESEAWRYLVDKRCVHSRTIEIAPIGMIPKDATKQVKNLFDPLIEKAETTAHTKNPGRPSKRETTAQVHLRRLKEAEEKLLQTIKNRSGWLTFFYADSAAPNHCNPN